MEPRIQYAKTSDGVDIAYAVIGNGPPILVLRQFLAPDVAADTSLHVDLTEAEVLAQWQGLVEHHTVVIWDYRGAGLSGPGLSTLESGLLDMQAVISTLELSKFDILAMLTPSHFAISYASQYPERVNRMVLWNPTWSSMNSTWGLPDIARTHFREYADLAALRIFGWDRAEQARRFSDRLADRYSGETWDELNASIEAIDARQMASSVRTPTLVIIDASVRNMRLVVPQRQQYMREVAASIPSAQVSIVQRMDPGAFLRQVEAFLSAATRAEDEPPLSKGREVPSGTAVIFFADIADSTALTERLGDAAFRAKARELDGALRKVISDNGGTCIDAKTLGDGVLAVFTSARQAIEAALACGEAGASAGMPLHLGLHAGDVIREDNNVYGGAVNIASRISGLSAPGEVLVSETVRSLARTSAGVRFEDRGEQALKGVGEPVRLWAVAPGE